MRKLLCLVMGALLSIVMITPIQAFYNNSNSMECVLALVENATEHYDSTVNVKDCRLSTTELTTYFWEASAGSVFRDLIDGFTYKYSGSYVESIILNYRYDRTSTATILTRFKELSDELIASLDPQMNDLDKLFYLHNYLALHTVYDSEAADYSIETGATTADSKYALSFSTVGPLFNGKAVCSGYSQGYLYLLDKIGIEAKYLTSSSMNHGWNIVKYNGNWYHVDITYDDPIPDVLGFVDYKYFMMNDEEMSVDHSWDDKTISMTSKTLASDNYIFNQSISDAFYYDGYWYYVKEQKIVRSKIDGSEFAVVSDASNVMDIYMHDGTIFYTTSANGYFLTGVYETNYLNQYNIEISTLRSGVYVNGLYHEDGKLYLTKRDGEVNYIDVPSKATFEVYLDKVSVDANNLSGNISSYLNYHSTLYPLRHNLQVMLDGEVNDIYIDTVNINTTAYTFSIPYKSLYNDTYKLKIVYGESIYDFLSYDEQSYRFDGLNRESIIYENGELTVTGNVDYVPPVIEFDYSPYGNGLFPIYENSRVTHLNMYNDHTLHISGYALEQFNNYSRSYSFVRELVMVEMTTGLEYRIGLEAIYNPFLNGNKTLNPDGSYDYSYAFYDSTINFNQVYSYWDKQLTSLPVGTYRLFIRLSDGKRSNVISLQDTKTDEVNMPRSFFIIDGSNDVGMNYGV
ncbi:MAG: hypothetical protein IKM20_05300 [Erysipelotrichales bacterium]|nr:hypothetical protein [Erysipelotrichales bacterium]